MRTPSPIVIVFTLLTGLACNGQKSPPSEGIEPDRSVRPLNIGLTGSLQNPAFSPDGKSIVFTRFRDGYNRGASDLFIYDFGKGELASLIADGNSNVNLPGSVWNATINSIVFSSERETHDEIFLIPDTGTTGDEIQLTDRSDMQSFEPTLSPDGQWILFESHRIDTEDDGVITKYKIDGSSGYVNLTMPGDNCRQPNWSPVGERILYQRKEDGMWAIWTMTVDGENKTKITDPGESATDAVFSSDGLWIVYSSENDDAEFSDIHMIPSSGGEATRISTSGGYHGAPSISPDGAKIVFESIDRDPDGSSGTALWMIDVP